MWRDDIHFSIAHKTGRHRSFIRLLAQNVTIGLEDLTGSIVLPRSLKEALQNNLLSRMCKNVTAVSPLISIINTELKRFPFFVSLLFRIWQLYSLTFTMKDPYTPAFPRISDAKIERSDTFVKLPKMGGQVGVFFFDVGAGSDRVKLTIIVSKIRMTSSYIPSDTRPDGA